jgi:hypothetical protein
MERKMNSVMSRLVVELRWSISPCLTEVDIAGCSRARNCQELSLSRRGNKYDF